MKQKTKIFLAKINPKLISIIPSLLQPTRWDEYAVEKDLAIYVALSRTISAVPKVFAHGNKLTIINGLPFVRAAQLSEPPLAEIICRIETDDHTLESLGINNVFIADLLQDSSTSIICNVFEMLVFVRPLQSNEKLVVEDAIRSFFSQMLEHRELGGGYRSLHEILWEDLNQSVNWSWEKSSGDGEHMIICYRMLQEIASKFPFRSWNGMSYPWFALSKSREAGLSEN